MVSLFTNHVSKRRHDIDRVVAEIIYIFTLPIFLLKIGAIPLQYRFFVLTTLSFAVLSIIHHEKWTEEELGFYHKSSVAALASYGAFAIFGTLFLIWYAKHLGFHALDVDDLSVSWRLVVFFIPVSVFQEIVYRGFLMPRLHGVFKNKIQVVLLNAALFALLHIIYPKPLIMLPLAFVSGIVFAMLYEKYPNIILISIVHAILNFVAVMFGFFTA